MYDFISEFQRLDSFIGLKTKLAMYLLCTPCLVNGSCVRIYDPISGSMTTSCLHHKRSTISIFRHISEKSWLPTPFHFLPTPLYFLPTPFFKIFKMFTYPTVLFTYPNFQNFQNFTYPNHFLPTPMIFFYLPPLPTPYLPPSGVGGVG